MPRGHLSVVGQIEHAQKLQIVNKEVEELKKALPAEAKAIFDNYVVLRPADFWSTEYLKLLADLSLALVAFRAYQNAEIKELSKKTPNVLAAGQAQKLALAKWSQIRQMLLALQLNPAAVRGEKRHVNLGLELDGILREVQDEAELI